MNRYKIVFVVGGRVLHAGTHGPEGRFSFACGQTSHFGRRMAVKSGTGKVSCVKCRLALLREARDILALTGDLPEAQDMQRLLAEAGR